MREKEINVINVANLATLHVIVDLAVVAGLWWLEDAVEVAAAVADIGVVVEVVGGEEEWVSYINSI